MQHPQHLQVGDRVPDTAFKVRADGEWGEISGTEIFGGRTVLLFALPGAFTPTCTTSHLPGFASAIDRFKELGVDEIFCLSVNDWFVMEAWRESLGISTEVTLLADGNADFTKGMGLLVDKRNLGFGERSWRYAMIVRDGTIDAIFVEDFDDEGDPFSVSGAPQLLEYLEKERDAAE